LAGMADHHSQARGVGACMARRRGTSASKSKATATSPCVSPQTRVTRSRCERSCGSPLAYSPPCPSGAARSRR
jgi:hypothetical protein